MAMDYTRIISEILPSGHEKENSGLRDDTITQGFLLLHADTKRLTAESGFTNLVGTTNEINTNIVAIRAPKKVEDHELGNCDNKLIKWHNLTSGEKGASELASGSSVDDDTHQWLWIIPPEALTAEGNIKIALTFYDRDSAGTLTYQWNSLPYSDLRVEKGMDEVSIHDIPADSTITIDLESRQITIPSGMQTELGKAGEVGLAKLRFRCDRFYRNIDFLKGNFQIVYEDADGIPQYNEVTMLPQVNGPDGAMLEQRSDLLEFEWNAQEAVSRVGEGTLNFIVAYTYIPEGKSGSVLWKSNICSYFTIGQSFAISGEADPTTGATELIISNGANLDTMLDELLGEGPAPTKSTMTTNEAIAYAIQRLLNSEIIFDANDD